MSSPATAPCSSRRSPRESCGLSPHAHPGSVSAGGPVPSDPRRLGVRAFRGRAQDRPHLLSGPWTPARAPPPLGTHPLTGRGHADWEMRCLGAGPLWRPDQSAVGWAGLRFGRAVSGLPTPSDLKALRKERASSVVIFATSVRLAGTTELFHPLMLLKTSSKARQGSSLECVQSCHV